MAHKCVIDDCHAHPGREVMCRLARVILFVDLTFPLIGLQIPSVSAQRPLTGILAPSASDAQLDSQPANEAVLDDVENGRPGEVAVGVDQRGYISGTVKDSNGNVVPGATIELRGPRLEDSRTIVAGLDGAFQFDSVRPGTPYQITIGAKGLESWKSQPLMLKPGQYFFLTDIELKVPGLVTSVTVYADREQIATEQVDVEIKQRVFGFIPNFYVTYDSDPVPLTPRLKYKLALKADTDVITAVGVAFVSALYQAGDMPDYGQGAKGYFKRMGAGYADTTTDIFLGGAVLPALLDQDPRYFYQGTGTKKSRAFHAILSPFVCRGDNGKRQPNYSSIGGDLASGAISNLYYPQSNRGVSLVFEGFLVTTGARMVNSLVQEFLLRKLTPSARAKY